MPNSATSASKSVAALLNPALESLLWPSARPTQGSAWHGHVAFAHWIATTRRPRIVVELGTQAGVSYAAFCQAVAAGQWPARCFAVDTWLGDKHAGTYGEEIFEDLTAFNDTHYRDFSTLLRMTFDDALTLFEDSSIDLLHIDGLHTYEAVRHDFETWLPKLSDRAVVLFHDTEIRQSTFGVWKLWEELAARYPSFSFQHSAGLGVLAAGASPPPTLAALCALRNAAHIARIRRLMERCSEYAQAPLPLPLEEEGRGGG